MVRAPVWIAWPRKAYPAATRPSLSSGGRRSCFFGLAAPKNGSSPFFSLVASAGLVFLDWAAAHCSSRRATQVASPRSPAQVIGAVLPRPVSTAASTYPHPPSFFWAPANRWAIRSRAPSTGTPCLRAVQTARMPNWVFELSSAGRFWAWGASFWRYWATAGWSWGLPSASKHPGRRFRAFSPFASASSMAVFSTLV